MTAQRRDRGSVVTLRPATDADREFLLAVYGVDARRGAVDQVAWAPGQREAFVRMQFDAQDAEYRRLNPRRQLRRDRGRRPSRPAGCTSTAAPATISDRRHRAAARVPRARASAEALIAGAQARPPPSGRIVSIHVEIHNRAAGLYERLGFVPVAEAAAVYRRMEWRSR